MPVGKEDIKFTALPCDGGYRLYWETTDERGKFADYGWVGHEAAPTPEAAFHEAMRYMAFKLIDIERMARY